MKMNQELVNAAIDGFKAQKLRIDAQIAELRSMLNGSPAESTAAPETTPRKRRKMSIAARRRIAMAQKARWAGLRGESGQTAPALRPTQKRRISPEGLRRIIAATKKRWRLQKAAAKAKSA
jgi:hypothetical protein